MPRHSLIFREPKETKIGPSGTIQHVLVKGALTRTGRARFELQRDLLADAIRAERGDISDADTIEWLARDKQIPEKVLRERLAWIPRKRGEMRMARIKERKMAAAKRQRLKAAKAAKVR